MSFVWSWLHSGLAYAGLVDKQYKILVCGLDNVGKTTMEYQLCQKTTTLSFFRVKMNDDTVFNVQSVDLGGHCHFRLWRRFRSQNLIFDGIIFIIDAADKDRFNEARTELMQVFEYVQHTNRNIPILIFGNKVDKKGCVSLKELEKLIQLKHDDDVVDISCLPICCRHFEWNYNLNKKRLLFNKLKINSELAVFGYIQNIYSENKIISIDLIQLCSKYSGLLHNLLPKSHHPNIHISMCCIINWFGIREGFVWLARQIDPGMKIKAKFDVARRI